MEYLDVIYGKQKSFYSKAEVDYVYKKNGLSQDTLYSYCFRVCECLRDGSHPIQIKFFNFGYDVTATTVRHIKEFLKQAKFGCTPTTWTYSYADDFIDDLVKSYDAKNFTEFVRFAKKQKITITF